MENIIKTDRKNVISKTCEFKTNPCYNETQFDMI